MTLAASHVPGVHAASLCTSFGDEHRFRPVPAYPRSAACRCLVERWNRWRPRADQDRPPQSCRSSATPTDLYPDVVACNDLHAARERRKLHRGRVTDKEAQ